MRASTHGDYLIQLTRLRWFNCHLVREDDGLTLIDTNLPGSAADIIEAARRVGQPIVRIVLTHVHIDHAGSLAPLRDRLADAEVIVGTREAVLLSGDYDTLVDEPPAKLRGRYVQGDPPTRTVTDGDRIGSLVVVNAPGHTPGQIALMDERDGNLIAGDAFQTAGGIAVAGDLRLRFPFPALGTWHAPTAVTSARHLAAVAPKRLAVGHGRVLRNPLVGMERAIRQADE